MMYVACIEDCGEREVRVYPRRSLALSWLSGRAEALWYDRRDDNPPRDPDDLIDQIGDLMPIKMWIATAANVDRLSCEGRHGN